MGFTRNIGNRTTTYNITDSDSTILLAKTNTINVTNGNGIIQSDEFNADTVNVNGEIHVTNGSGIRLDGLGNTITTGFDSIITANIGIWLNNGGTDGDFGGSTILSQGQVVATGTAIRNENDETFINNFGTLRGDNGIVGVTYGLTLNNHKLAVIDGGSRGIDLTGVDDALLESKIVNEGTISGDIAIMGGAEMETITNRGKISGNVLLGAGNDLFDGRGGIVNGLIAGGAGNDIYIVDRSGINLQEQAGEGTGDTVESTVSFTLGGNFEYLQLLGKAKINGFGNEEDNIIYANSGNNTVKGRAGNDILYGGEGNDHLFGGTGADQFLFIDGSGHDTIMDFTPDGKLADAIGLSVSSISGFADLMKHHVEQHEHDLVINAGHGDTLTLHDVHKGDLNAFNFIFGAN